MKIIRIFFLLSLSILTNAMDKSKVGQEQLHIVLHLKKNPSLRHKPSAPKDATEHAAAALPKTSSKKDLHLVLRLKKAKEYSERLKQLHINSLKPSQSQAASASSRQESSRQKDPKQLHLVLRLKKDEMV
jgi:hypothetical protein